MTPEKEILSSAGLDAVIMTWSLKIGISLFLPMAVIGCAIRERATAPAAANTASFAVPPLVTLVLA